MPESMLMVQILKALAELALMFFLARGLLVLFFLPAPHKLEGNLIYGLFVKGTQPFVWFMRLITPRFVLDRHLPYAAFALLVVAWVACRSASCSCAARTRSNAVARPLRAVARRRRRRCRDESPVALLS